MSFNFRLKMHFALLFLFSSCTWSTIWGKTEISKNPVEAPLKIGAFNVQKLGNSKFGNEKVMNIVKKILVRYDLVLVQEIVTTDESLMMKLVQDLNKKVPKRDNYLLAISERVGRNVAKEQYAYLYRSEKLQFLDGHIYPDSKDDFMRPPYIVHFSTPTLRDIKSLVAIGIHTQPKNAANETSALAAVYDYSAQHYKQKNAIIMGDMNAGCSNVRIGDWDHIDLWTRENFTWLISHDMDTTISTNCCPYDRMVVAGAEMANAVILKSVHIFNFREAHDLSAEEALEISDHWPIEVELRGKISDDVAQYIVARVCVTVDDNRKYELPLEVQRQKSTMGFKIERSDLSTTLYTIGSDTEALLESLKKLANKYTSFISKEIMATVSYKVGHRALEDESSHNELLGEESHSVLVDFDEREQTVTIHFCSETTAN